VEVDRDVNHVRVLRIWYEGLEGRKGEKGGVRYGSEKHPRTSAEEKAEEKRRDGMLEGCRRDDGDGFERVLCGRRRRRRRRRKRKRRMTMDLNAPMDGGDRTECILQPTIRRRSPMRARGAPSTIE
jgi:hypothetical protein